MQEVHKEDVAHTAKRQGSALAIAFVVALLYVLGWQLFGADLEDSDYREYFGGYGSSLTDALPDDD